MSTGVNFLKFEGPSNNNNNNFDYQNFNNNLNTSLFQIDSAKSDTTLPNMNYSPSSLTSAYAKNVCTEILAENQAQNSINSILDINTNFNVPNKPDPAAPYPPLPSYSGTYNPSIGTPYPRYF